MIIKSSFFAKTIFLITLITLVASCKDPHSISESDQVKLELLKSLDTIQVQSLIANKNSRSFISDSLPKTDSLFEFWNGLQIEKKKFIFENYEQYRELISVNKKNTSFSKLFESVPFEDSPITESEALEIIGESGNRNSSIQEYLEIHTNITALVKEHKYDINLISLQIYHAESNTLMGRRLRKKYGHERIPALSDAELTGVKTVVIRIIYDNEWVIDKSLDCKSCSPSKKVRTIFDVGRPCPPICPGGTDNWNTK